jgi:mannonate dehydratase
MKITEVRTIVTCPGRNYVLLKILTDAGVYGVGDATLNGRELSVAETLKEHIGPWLVGKDPRRIEDIWQELFRGTYWRGGPVLQTALAGVDMALWDIKGKLANLPCYELFGGKCREKVRIYSHCGGNSFEEALDSARRLMERGVTVLRIHCGVPGSGGKPDFDWMGDEARKVASFWDPAAYCRTMPKFFAFLRENLGEEIDFCHDVHERINPIQACKLAKDLEGFRLFFLEDPLRPEHKESFRLLRQHSATPIAMGEVFHTPWEYLTLVTEQLIDFVRLDVDHFGGITPARKMAAIAEPYQIDMAFHGPGDICPITHAANVHIDLSIPNFGVQEWTMRFPPELSGVVIGGPTYDGAGYVTVDDTPGLGVDIVEEAAAKYPYQRRFIPTLRKADGSVTDW